MSNRIIFSFPSDGGNSSELRKHLESIFKRDVLIPVLELPKTTNNSSPQRFSCHEDLSDFLVKNPEWKSFIQSSR